METEIVKKKRYQSKKQYFIIKNIGVVLFLLCAVGLGIISVKYVNEKPEIVTESTLIDMINISNLSTAEFIYNGIAQIYDDDENVKCNIKYCATVKAGVNMEDVTFGVDNKEKIIKTKIPEIKITSNVVDTEEIDFLPSDADVDLKEVIAVCEKDAEEESKNTMKLMEAAEESLKANINGLLMPILSGTEYHIVWE